jgi:UDP-GlcNAc:undecaprenyl-phosphate GlcNAc-1-phosphate transferase
MTYIIFLFLSIALNYALRKLFIKKNIVDAINHRSSHIVKATRTGGLVLFTLILAYTIFLYVQGIQPYDFSIMIPISILFITGLYDDIYHVDFGLKFIFQIIAAKILIDLGYVIDIFSFFGIELEFSRIISQIISIIFYVSIFNAYNFIDGIDLNIHLETIKNLLFLLIMFNYNIEIEKLILITGIIMIANALFNYSKKLKVFMGDSGSLIIPLVLIIFIFEGIKINPDQNIIKYLFLIFMYPLFDLARVVLIRLKIRKSPFIADKNHLHHFLEKKFNNHFYSSLTLAFLSTIIQCLIYLLIIY